MIWILNRNPDVSVIESPPAPLDVDKLRRHSVLLIRSLFSREEVAAIRQSVTAVVARAYQEGQLVPLHRKYPSGRAVLGDLLGMPELSAHDYLVFDSRVLECARAILGPKLVYFGDSTILMGTGGRGFHQDFVDPGDSETWAVRLLLYLQDHSTHSGGLKLRLGSHLRTSRHRGPMINVPSRAGDVIAFYLRSAHTGNNVHVRGSPGLCLHPKLENVLPRALAASKEQERLCAVLTFGLRGPQLSRYVSWISRNPAHLRRSGYDTRLLQLAERHGVELMKCIDEHGALQPRS